MKTFNYFLLLVAAMGTEKGSRAVAEAIKDIEVEKIRGPGDASSAKLATFWEKQVTYSGSFCNSFFLRL